MPGQLLLPSEPIQLPLLPLRDVVVFPHMVIPLFVGRPKSIKALEAAMETGKSVLLVAQKAAAKDEPSVEDLYEVGCIASILQMLKLPDGTVKVLVKRIKAARMPKEALKKAESELKKLKLMSPMSAEATVIRNFIDTLVNLPWRKKSKINNDLTNAEKVLNEDHYGLDKVKERILEYLAVQQRVDRVKAPILCLVGPPGVGKTSLGQSVARATNRKFVRMALGGVRDESEIRGHRRTYIGSMPGKILTSLTKVGVRNPL
ncbi:MAG: AAA family ATPase, partial [Burkholderiaceae bacterium]|nr:AAA family ATPase [Burkholderiaceae bacterium]